MSATRPEPGSQVDAGRKRSRAAAAVLGLIGAYQRLVSPVLGSRCRFHPTCSTYASEAIEQFGIARGGWLAARRIGRCHPFAEGGVDRVPDRYTWWGRRGEGSPP